MENSVVVRPSLAFDERGHKANTQVYGVFARGGGKLPAGFYRTVEEFIGEGGDFENPGALCREISAFTPAGTETGGYEAMGGIAFEQVTLNPGEKFSFVIALCYGDDGKALSRTADAYLTREAFQARLEKTKAFWREKNNISFESGDPCFDQWMYWVSFQPELRRIYGCSFLPGHDYGRGGRGWRDLWQDCLALILKNPSGVRKMLLDGFGGVRMDGTNATIIGKKQGEFPADRNGISRVWMDHGMWPYLTLELYIRQSGDLEILLEQAPYFRDGLICRGEDWDDAYDGRQENRQETVTGERYMGTVLEHVLLEHLTAFYDAGGHNHMRLRDADWNDALDMAGERGESVAFTAAYAGNMESLAAMLAKMKKSCV